MVLRIASSFVLWMSSLWSRNILVRFRVSLDFNMSLKRSTLTRMRLNTKYLSNLSNHHSLKRRPLVKKVQKMSLPLRSLPQTVEKRERRRALRSVSRTGNGPCLTVVPRTFLSFLCKARVLVLVTRSGLLKSPQLKAQKVPALMVVQVSLPILTVTWDMRPFQEQWTSSARSLLISEAAPRGTSTSRSSSTLLTMLLNDQRYYSIHIFFTFYV